jgi:hypothetical protein
MADEMVLNIEEAERVVENLLGSLWSWRDCAYATVEYVARITGYSVEEIAKAAGRG